MRKILPLASGAVIVAALAGCAIVPYPEPAVVYAAPPPPAVIVRPSHGYHGYRGGRYWHRRWH
jgi:hypothetical protein